MRSISYQAARLKKIRLYLGLTREQLADSIGISQFTLRSWENGLKKFTPEGAQRFVSSLNEKINFSCSFEWLMHGVGTSPISHYEDQKSAQPLKKITITTSHEKILNEIANFKQLNTSASVIAVSNNMFYPIAEPGDYIGFTSINIKKLKNYIGKILYISLKNENSYFGVLEKKHHSFQIICLNNASAIEVKAHTLAEIFLLIWLRKNF
jgi:DNA-binding XRE family transcriptional regulator/small nuclear ribonucleoprotein (snRNP)-like protein